MKTCALLTAPLILTVFSQYSGLQQDIGSHYYCHAKLLTATHPVSNTLSDKGHAYLSLVCSNVIKASSVTLYAVGEKLK